MVPQLLKATQPPSEIHAMFSLLLYIRSERLLNVVFGFFGSQCCEALAWSLIWYLGPALLSSLYFGNDLLYTINNYLFSLFYSRSQLVEDRRNGISSLFPCGLVKISFEYFENLWVTNILLLLGLQNVFLLFCCIVICFVFLRLKKLVKNTTQESAPRQCGGGWQSTCNSCLL